MLIIFQATNVKIDMDDKSRVWFLAQDVMSHLGLCIENTARHLQRNVFPEYKQKRLVGEGRPAWYIAEPGIYQLTFKAATDEARNFQSWVFEEVIPSIRRDGGYISPEATTEQLEALQSQIDIQQNMILQMGRDLTELTSKKKEYETKVNDWETEIKNDIDGDPMTYYKFLKDERKGYLELEAQAKQLNAVKEALKLNPTKAKIIELILAGSGTK
jgi:prophage antirepressor-like protein